MKNFVPFFLIKAVLTAALFGGIPGVSRGLTARADEVEYFCLYENNQIFLLNEDTFIAEITAYRSPGDPTDNTYYFETASGAEDLEFNGIVLSGTTGTGSDTRDNVDVSNATISLESSNKNYVVDFQLYGRGSPETILEDQHFLFYVSNGNTIQNLPIRRIISGIDLSRWWLLSAQIHEENRAPGYNWTEYPFASPVPVNTVGNYGKSKYSLDFVPVSNYLAKYGNEYYYNTSWGCMYAGAPTVHSSYYYTAGYTLRNSEEVYLKVGETNLTHWTQPAFYMQPKTYPANTGDAFIYSFGYGVFDTSTDTLYPVGAVFQSDRLRFLWGDFLTQTISSIYAGDLAEEEVSPENNLAAFDLFRVCIPAEVNFPPAPQPEPEEPLLKTDFSSGGGAVATVVTAIATTLFTGFYILPAIVAGEILSFQRGEPNAIVAGVALGAGIWLQFFVDSWNNIFSVIQPVAKAIQSIIDAFGRFFSIFIEKIAPILKPFIDWILTFIGNYWYIILPAALAIWIAVRIQRNRRR